jgi:hypothetical protein
MENIKSTLNIWKVLGIVLTVLLLAFATSNVTDYCISKSHDAALNIAGVLLPIILIWLAYKLIRKIIN